MEKYVNISMNDGIMFDVAGTPFDIIFMVGIIIKDVHETAGVPYEELGKLLNSVVKDLSESDGEPDTEPAATN